MKERVFTSSAKVADIIQGISAPVYMDNSPADMSDLHVVVSTLTVAHAAVVDTPFVYIKVFCPRTAEGLPNKPLFAPLIDNIFTLLRTYTHDGQGDYFEFDIVDCVHLPEATKSFDVYAIKLKIVTA